jgi:hypothetical protein
MLCRSIKHNKHVVQVVISADSYFFSISNPLWYILSVAATSIMMKGGAARKTCDKSYIRAVQLLVLHVCKYLGNDSNLFADYTT